MFGGLELKGGGSKEEDAAAPASSGFSFMNTSAPAAPEPASAPEAAPAAAPASSGFSFLIPSEPVEPAPAPDAPAMSGFSFLQPAEAPAAADPEPTPVSAEPEQPAAASGDESAFNFLMSSTASEPPAPAPEPASLGFDFLMSTADSTPAPAPALEISTTPPAPEEAPAVPAPNLLDIATPATTSTTSSISTMSNNSNLPAGAGITFGTASKRPGGVKKKKSRAARVGTGANSITPSSPQKAPRPPEQPAVETKASARDDAEAAAKRADEFLKTMEQQQQQKESTTVPDIQMNPSTDSVLEKAQQAAKKAQKMKAPAAQPAKSGFMGTFFKGFGGNNSQSQKSAKDTSGVDHLAKQQKDMKRAAAERQMKQMHQKPTTTTTAAGPNDNNDDDDEYDVVVSSSSKYPEIIPSSAAVTENITFAPAKKAPVAPPPPKKKKTPQELFEDYQAMFAQSVSKGMKQVDNVRSTQKMLLEERFVAMAKENLATQQINQVETQLQNAVDEEDYELADQLGQVAEAHKREKEEVKLMLDANLKALDHLNGQKHLVVKGVATCFENLATRLQDLETNSEQKENDVGTFSKFEAISKQLSAEQERLQQDAKHLERDEALVGEERKELEAAILEQSGVLETQRDDVKSKLDQVEEEMEELRKKLAAKQKVAAGLRTEMHGLEDGIDKVRVKFSRQLTRVDKKEKSLKENRNEWKSEQLSYENQKKAHELQVQSYSEAMLAHDQLMSKLQSELGLTKTFTEIIPTKLGFLEDSVDAEEGDLAQLQADVVKCEAAVSEAKIVLQAATTQIQTLESTHASLLQKIPQLEQQKKTAAASRDYKAASKANKEIKDASARLKECEEELVGEASQRQTSAQEEMEKLTSELDKAKAVALEKEKVSGLEKMQLLAKKIAALEETKQELCGSASTQENTVQGVGALVLEGQIAALRQEGEMLGEKYGGWNELMPGDGSVLAEKKEEEQPQDDGLSSRQRVLLVRDLLRRIQEAEAELEKAAAEEDFDRAAELHDTFQELQSELEGIPFSEEEMELAMSDQEIPEEEEEVVLPAAEEEVPEAAEETSPEDDGENDAKEDKPEEAPPATEEEDPEAAEETSPEDDVENDAKEDKPEEAAQEKGNEDAEQETEDVQEEAEANDATAEKEEPVVEATPSAAESAPKADEEGNAAVP